MHPQQYWVDPPPANPSIKVGCDVRKRGETLTWEVVHLGEYDVVLIGPAGRRGLMTVQRREFDEKWERA